MDNTVVFCISYALHLWWGGGGGGGGGGGRGHGLHYCEFVAILTPRGNFSEGVLIGAMEGGGVTY